MKSVGVRLVEVLAAALLAGVIVVFYNGVASGIWNYGMLLVVPVSFMWSILLGVMAIAQITMVVFFLLAGVVTLAVYMVARFARPRWLRIGLETAVFLAQVFAMPVLFAMMQIVV